MKKAFSVKQIQAGYCLSYILESDSEAVLIDPHITKIEQYRNHLAKNALKLKTVIDTHTHADHISSASIIADEFGCPLVILDASTIPARPAMSPCVVKIKILMRST